MNIFLRPEEAMIEIWQKLVFWQFICSVIEKIIHLNFIKQNEKHPYMLSFVTRTQKGMNAVMDRACREAR